MKYTLSSLVAALAITGADAKLFGSKKLSTPSSQKPIFDSVSGFLSCEACYLGVDAFDAFIQSSTFLDPVEEACSLICNLVMNKDECTMFVKNNEPLVMRSLLGFNLKSDFFCEQIMPICDTQYYTELPP